MKKAFAFGILSLTLATAASAQVKPEDQIKFRQAGYSFMSWNMGKIKANLEGEFNAQQVQAAASAIAGIAGSGMGALYGPGTDGVTIEPTEPGLPKRILRRTATPMPHYAMGLVPHIETVHDRLTVEIRRGCTRGCRFCHLHNKNFPCRLS